MRRKGKYTFIFLILMSMILALVAGMYFYNKTNIITDLNKSGMSVALKNPVLGISDDEAVLIFDESFVYYLLRSIKAYNLHNPPFSSDTPKIEIYVSDEIYNAEVVKGKITVNIGEMDEEDIIIRTNKEEAVKMLRSFSYVEGSFAGGKSSIEMVSGKTELFSKGYLNLYNEITGKNL